MRSHIKELDQLVQLSEGVIWDGNVISKADRDSLCKKGYADRYEGFNFITAAGVKYLVDRCLLKRGEKPYDNRSGL